MKRKTHPVIFTIIFSLSLIASASADGEMEVYPQREVKTPATVVVNKSPTGDYIEYSAFGAAADGKHDDFNALLAAHLYANEKGLAVRADPGGTYYLGGSDRTIPVQTDTDWLDARFIIDDRRCQNRAAHVFAVTSKTPPYVINGVTTLDKGARNLGRPLDTDCLVIVVNKNVRRYIRYGLNENTGYPQGDVCIVRKNGDIDANTPVLWDFEKITSLTAHPMDERELTVRGGVFTTIANRDPSRYTYYKQGIAIQRSRVTVENVTHNITGERDHGAPYAGFISVQGCAAVRIKSCILTGHKTYDTIGSAGKKVPMGSYDLAVDGAVNVSFEQCTQTNDILDTRYWGILASNYCKNLVYDGCVLSRFDAHMGVFNATLKNSTLGHQGVNAIGSGVLRIENCRLQGRSLINLRPDYGSTWKGEVVIKDCVFVPRGGASSDVVLLSGENRGTHDFGYVCHMPEKITIDGLVIHDANTPRGYTGPKIFGDFNPACVNESYEWKYPYSITEEVVMRNLTVTSGLPYRISTNVFMFRNVTIKAPEGE